MAEGFSDDAEGFLKCIKHFYKGDEAVFDECKALVAAACAHVKITSRKNL